MYEYSVGSDEICDLFYAHKKCPTRISETSDIPPAFVRIGSSLYPQENYLMQKNYVPYGSDVSSGTFECVDCGHQYSNQAKTSIPPCPQYKKSTHTQNGWKVLTGQGDAVIDPYPQKTEKTVDINQAETSSPVSKK
jgi:hypothetical protein